VEHALDKLAEQQGRLIMKSEEAGTFFGVINGQLYGRGNPNIDGFLGGYDGSPLRVGRRNERTIDLPRSCLSLLLMPQPNLMMEQVKNTKLRGRGFIARFVLARPQPFGLRLVRDDGSKTCRGGLAQSKYAEAIERLFAWPIDARGPGLLTLSAGAFEIWMKFQNELNERGEKGGDLETISDWTRKHEGRVGRIAAGLYCVDLAAGGVPRCPDIDGDFWSWEIPADVMGRAVAIGRYLLEQARVVLMGPGELGEKASTLIEWLKRRGHESVTLRQIKKNPGHRWDKEVLLRVISLLKDYGYLQEEDRPHQTDARVFFVNPAVLNR